MNAVLRTLHSAALPLRIDKTMLRAEKTRGTGDGPAFTVGKF